MAECAWICSYVEELPEREGEIIGRRFYLGEALKKIVEVIGLSKERIRQIEIQALARLRKRIEAKR